MELDGSVENIKQGKRYLYIFDFMCTGTELKIVSALVNSKKGVIKGAVGISRYKSDVHFSFPGGISVLVEGNELETPYIIVGKEEYIPMLRGENRNE